ncbi:hypothetical protein CEV33_2970 [Brucella grignonensis]|uniref:Uncharacterized protein n=1 Tax=Brucella grignonensis TaxID=94627 RepID=A0A256F491_9HYPH|nr:hypothetical protein CEV33_2970 [Brucella grignonensis]
MVFGAGIIAVAAKGGVQSYAEFRHYSLDTVGSVIVAVVSARVSLLCVNRGCEMLHILPKKAEHR